MSFMADGDVETLLALKEHITIDLYTRIQKEQDIDRFKIGKG